MEFLTLYFSFVVSLDFYVVDLTAKGARYGGDGSRFGTRGNVELGIGEEIRSKALHAGVRADQRSILEYLDHVASTSGAITLVRGKIVLDDKVLPLIGCNRKFIQTVSCSLIRGVYRRYSSPVIYISDNRTICKVIIWAVFPNDLVGKGGGLPSATNSRELCSKGSGRSSQWNSMRHCR